jgi:putative ABC transport system ATP-binding protein
MVLELRSVAKYFDDGEKELKVLQGASLELGAGESLSLLGASGNGKSTLLQIAAGLEPPDAGEVIMLGRSLATLSERDLALLRRQHLGFVFQQFNLLPGLNVNDNVLFQRRINRQGDRDEWTDEITAVLGLTPLLNRPVEVLSSGQQQRVAIARALAHKPRLLFADEPTGNLHDSLSLEVMALMIRLVKESACGLLMVTHNMEMATFTDRRLMLEDGRLHEL